MGILILKIFHNKLLATTINKNKKGQASLLKVACDFPPGFGFWLGMQVGVGR